MKNFKTTFVVFVVLGCLVVIGSVIAAVIIYTKLPVIENRLTNQPAENTVTLANNNQTINLKVGERFLLKLGENYNWTINVSDEAVVSRVVNILVVRGAQGVYEARGVGQATIEAVGDPTCRQSVPACATPSVLFKLNVVVK